MSGLGRGLIGAEYPGVSFRRRLAFYPETLNVAVWCIQKACRIALNEAKGRESVRSGLPKANEMVAPPKT